MAANKFYSYYLRGNQIALIEQDLDDNSRWKSPVSTVADALEIEYAYSPQYFIESTDLSTTTVASWDQDNNGNLRFHASGGTDWTSSPNLSSVSYVVLRNAGRWNGLHKVSSVDATRIYTTTKASTSTVNTDFEETVTLYYDVDVLNDESDTIDLPEYLAKALVYYVKAKVFEDGLNIEAKEYFLKEFRRMLEKHENSKVWGPRMVSSGINAIR